MLSGRVLLAHGDRAAYLLVTGAEDLEMVGIILAIRALTRTMRTERVQGGWTLLTVAPST